MYVAEKKSGNGFKVYKNNHISTVYYVNDLCGTSKFQAWSKRVKSHG